MRKILKTSDSNEDTNEPLDTFYSFVLTDYELNRTYCTCLVFNVTLFLKKSKKSLLKMTKIKLLILHSWKIQSCLNRKIQAKSLI